MNVLEKPLEECSFAEEQFDVVTMWGVLEHLLEPRQLLRQIRDFLTDGGLLVVEVPSFDCLLVEYLKAHPEQADRIIDGWGHVTLFSVPTITRMLQEQGYVVEQIQSLG
ncbi:MAG: class I SAM-dependent methyltransferase, partial [Gemmatimonadetes bacterium]|nr:class I SAM-dependent methyltransferase [Gemmatimonadota bacterium]